VRKLLGALLLAAATCAAFAQTGGSDSRGNTPPGTSRDGSGPADGAIKGGTAESESGSRTPAQDAARCRELAGQLREQCLREVGARSTAPSGMSVPSAARRDPAQPPPQNPQQPR
jgi:hypothetical protein